MGWNIGFRAGPVGYSKRIGGSAGAGRTAPPTLAEQVQINWLVVAMVTLFASMAMGYVVTKIALG